MSPALAVLYFLLASSPVWRHESSPMTSESWESRFPSTFEHSNNFESLFNNEWETEEPMFSTRRHFLNEMTGLEMPSMFETTSEESPIKLMKLAKIVKRIAKVHPILVEKLLSHPELIRVIVKIVRRNPEVARLVLKKLIKNTERRSIVSEIFPMTEESTLFSTPFSTEESLFNVESPIIRRLVKKLIKSEESSPIFKNFETRHLIEKIARRNPEVARLVKKLIKKSVVPTTFDFDFESETTPFSTLFNNKNTESECPITRRAIEKIIRRLVKSNTFEHESTTPFSTLFESAEESPIMTRRFVEKMIRNPVALNKVIRRLAEKKTPFEHREVESVRPVVAELLSTLSHVEPKIVKMIVKKALRHELPVEVVLSKVLRNPIVLNKIVRRLVKKNIFENESTLSHEMPESHKVEKVCRVCENVCEPMNTFVTPVLSAKVCRVCEKVCRPTFGRHFGLERFDF